MISFSLTFEFDPSVYFELVQLFQIIRLFKYMLKNCFRKINVNYIKKFKFSINEHKIQEESDESIFF